MGIFLNQGNLSFVAALEDKIYVDKSGIIKYTNEVLGKRSAFICNSRPRRFGKSMAVELLNAYYSKGCKSRELFSNLEIAKDPSFETHLNKYDAIHLDIQGLITSARGKR